MSDMTSNAVALPAINKRLIGAVICILLGVGAWFLLHSIGEENVWAKTGLFIFILFFLLGSGVWVGLALMAVAYIGLDVFVPGIAGDRMLTTIWTSSGSSRTSSSALSGASPINTTSGIGPAKPRGTAAATAPMPLGPPVTLSRR